MISITNDITMISNCLPEFNDVVQENWDWVDQRLEELYYGYSLTSDNCDEYQDAGLLKEKWAWVDSELRKKYYNYVVNSDNIDEVEEIEEVDLHSRFEDCNESVLGKRKRAESDISDHEEEVIQALERLACKSPSICSFLQNYDYDYAEDAEDAETVSSLDLESDKCSDLEYDVDGYDSDDYYIKCSTDNFI